MKKLLFLSIPIIFTMLLMACNSGGSSASESNSGDKGDGPEEITLRFMTNLPDRSTGRGKVEQDILDAFMEENPNITVRVEALQDEPYKDQIMIYASTDNLPDVLNTWGQPSFIDPLINNDLLLALNEEDYEDYGFAPGSTDGWIEDGKLFGLPKYTDMFVLYYNNRLFEENNIAVPTTQSDLLEAVKAFRELRINPVSINGMDGWSLPIWFEYVVQRETGDFGTMNDALARNTSFDSPEFLKAAERMKELVEAGMFQDGFLTADYGTARNLFGQEQAAMYLMGSWEMGLATDENFPESFRENLGVIPYPASDNGLASHNDFAAWSGSGFSVSANTEHPEEAVKLLNFLFKPENWAKTIWQSGNGVPSQQFDEFFTGEETDFQLKFTDLFNQIESASGTPVLDNSTAEFKERIMNIHQSLLSGQITPEDFVKQIDEAAERASDSQ